MNFKNIKIGFIGNMNAMPMSYALQFKEDGFDVKYIVESSKDEILMRPENHYTNINYPYPYWIQEISFKSKSLIRLLFNRYSSQDIYEAMSDRDVIFFNHYGHNLSYYFDNKIIKIALFSGADLDVKCNYHQIENNISKNGILFIDYIKKKLFKKVIDRYRQGIRSCDIISYFPKGMNKLGDTFLDEIMENKSFSDIRRYDVYFKGFNLEYLGAKNDKKLVLFSGVRFLIKTSKDNISEYKGNDLIIKGIAKYYRNNLNIEVHFVEKGDAESIKIAKELCVELGLEKIVIWHQTMPLNELFDLYKKSDVVFDQVGLHWLGAIGVYALYMGKPLIANARLDVFGSIWGDKSPILNASSVNEIYKHLIDCESYEFRKEVGEKSHVFAKDFFDASITYKKYKTKILELYTQRGK